MVGTLIPRGCILGLEALDEKRQRLEADIDISIEQRQKNEVGHLLHRTK